MKKRGISIAAILIVCVFVGTLAVTAVGICNDYSMGLESAAARFEKLSSRTTETGEYFPAGSKEFISTFNAAVGSPELYQSICLEIDGIEVYSYPVESKKTESVFVKAFSTRIVGGDGANINLAASIYTLPPASIFQRAKLAFVIILAGTFLACILLMYIYLSESASGEKASLSEDSGFAENDFSMDPVFGDEEDSEDDLALEASLNRSLEDDPVFEDEIYEGEESPDFTGENEDAIIEDSPEEQESETELQPALSETVQTAQPLQTEQPLQQEYTQESLQGAEPAPDTPLFSSEETAQTPELSETDQSEQGLFSPASGFGWESYLTTRLESELIRAASSEQDLSLIIIRIPELEAETPCYEAVCRTLLDFFQYKDFIFEYQNDGFAAIVQNKDVDQTLANAEELYTNITAALNSAGIKSKPVMGISSRSLRLISAERLKIEASQAVEHAREDTESPIVAFRVNPEKYRKYLNSQQA